MGYEVTVTLEARDAKSPDWRPLTDREESSLSRVSDNADYVVSNGSGKWYGMGEDLAKWTGRKSMAGVEVLAECSGEDGALWRVYARAGAYVEVHPTITWPEDPWVAPSPT